MSTDVPDYFGPRGTGEQGVPDLRLIKTRFEHRALDQVSLVDG
jgi:hypothetical protein